MNPKEKVNVVDKEILYLASGNEKKLRILKGLQALFYIKANR